MKFVHGGSAQYLGVRQRDHLRLADREGVEARNAGAALAARIRVVQTVIIDEIISGNLAEPRVCVDPAAAFVVSDGFRLRGGGKKVRADVRQRNVRQQACRRRRPRPGWDGRVGKNARRRAGTTLHIVRFALGDPVSQFLREQAGDVRTADRAGQRTCHIAQVARAVLRRGHRSHRRRDALHSAGSLVIEKEKRAILADRPAENSAILVLPVCAAGVVEEVPRIQVRVPQEFKGVAVKQVAAGFGHHIHQPAVIVPILGVEVAGQHPELLDGIQVWDHRCSAVHVFLHVDGIYDEAVRRFALSIDRNVSRIQIPGRINGSGHAGHDHRSGRQGRDRADTRLNRQQIRIAAAVQGNRFDLAVGNDLPKVRRHGIDLCLNGGLRLVDGNGLGLQSYL